MFAMRLPCIINIAEVGVSRISVLSYNLVYNSSDPLRLAHPRTDLSNRKRNGSFALTARIA
jgi:hypothetical protein